MNITVSIKLLILDLSIKTITCFGSFSCFNFEKEQYFTCLLVCQLKCVKCACWILYWRGSFLGSYQPTEVY